jgi:hypothetical protein
VAATPEMSDRPERSGRWVARAWKYLVRQEIRLARWMVSRGVPAGLALGLLWFTNVAFIVVVGYALFWLAVVLVIAGAVAWAVAHSEPPSKLGDEEWRGGLQGFGLYNRNGDRVIPWDPTEDP